MAGSAKLMYVESIWHSVFTTCSFTCRSHRDRSGKTSKGSSQTNLANQDTASQASLASGFRSGGKIPTAYHPGTYSNGGYITPTLPSSYYENANAYANTYNNNGNHVMKLYIE